MSKAPVPALAPGALTTLAGVNDWVFSSSPSAMQPTDAVPFLIRLINQASALTRSYLQRGNLLYHVVNEVRNGTGSATMLLKEYPVLGDLTLAIQGQSILKRPALSNSPTPQVGFNGYGAAGWVNTTPWDGMSAGGPATIALSGGCFVRGFGNVSIQYPAGYAVMGEAQTVVAGYQLFPLQPNGVYAGNVSVAYANGTLLVPVASSPAVGQYVPPINNSDPYLFAAADLGQDVLLSYSYIPADVDHAVCRWVGEAYRYRSRIGQRTQSIQGAETASYVITAMSDDIKQALQSFKLTVPILN